MKSDKLQDAIGMIDPDLVLRAEKTDRKKKTKRVLKWTSPIAAVLVLALAIGIFFGNDAPLTPTVYAIAEAEYPEIVKYPDDWNDKDGYNSWNADQKAQAAYFGTSCELDSFVSATAAEFLSGKSGENVVYSPINVYMALAILAETTDGETRKQILNLLGAESIESLRTQAHAVWNANYNDDGIVTSLLASSLWLKNTMSYNKETLETIAQNYYASSYSGEMGSEKYNEQLRAWLNEQTGELLAEYVKDAKLNPNTVLAIATTIYFKANWWSKFSESQNTEDVFHAEGGDITTEFMHQTSYRDTYFWGENFSAASIGLDGSGSMWFVLPDEDTDVNSLLADEEALTFISASRKGAIWENKKTANINFSVPKFDVDSKLDLIEGLVNLGVTDCFDAFASDFSPLTSERDDIYVSRIEHSARVVIDEEGVVGAAYTVITIETTCDITETVEDIDFVVDRPFIFVITGEDGSVLFLGVVNQP